MKITFLGAAQTVTGSRILFEHRHFKGLIDCGLFQGSRDLRRYNWTDQPELMDAQCVLLTHTHIDHSGYLPRLYKRGFRKPIYCSHPSADLLKVMLLDAAKLQEEDARYANASKYSNHDPALPLYDSEDALGCSKLTKAVDWNTWTPLSESLSFRMIRSGHILGSAYVQLAYTDGQESKIMTFSGDIGSQRSMVLRDPEMLLETDSLLIESTYGNRSFEKTDVKKELARIANEVFSRGGTLVIPSFAVGRAQDLLVYFWQLKKDKQIPDIPIYLDSPMAHKVTSIYLQHMDEFKRTKDLGEIEQALRTAVYKHVLTPDESMLLCMSAEPKIVISASGMLQGGRVLHHLKSKLPDAKNGVLFVGYQALGTKGRLLKDGLNKIRIHHREIDVEAQIYSVDGLSAHADSNEIVQWLGAFHKAPQITMINHGELESADALKFRIQTELGWNHVRVPALNETIHLE